MAMIINIETKNGIVSSAFFEQKKLSLSVFINTVKRWVTPDYSEHTGNSIKFGFIVDDDENFFEDYVELVAETEVDKKQIGFIHFLCHDKDQLWYLLADEAIYT